MKAADLARATDTPRSAISHYLSGDFSPRASRLRAICETLSIDLDETLAEKLVKQLGYTGERLRNIWSGMQQRCYSPEHYGFKYYGAKGVTVCDEWRYSFVAFKDWALSHGYQEHLTLDRIDPYGDYCPENCRWATWKEQAQNKLRRAL